MLFKNTQIIKRNIMLSSVVCLILLSIVYSTQYVLGQAMSSSNYKIQTDSVNFGGNRSTSTSYFIEDTSGEIATGLSSSTNYAMKAGYQQMQEVYIAMTAIGDVTMSPSIGGVSGGTSNGSTNFTVTTDNPAGYSVTIQASTSPALRSSLDSIADYTAPVASPDFTFSVPSTAARFAFTAEGTDIVNSFKDNGASCNVGSSDTANACWAGLSTGSQTILNRTSANHPSGTLTTLKFRAQSGSAHIQTAGTYVATTTVTAFSL